MTNFETFSESTKHATLPEALLTLRLGGMVVGDIAFTYEYALSVDDEHRCWLNSQAEITPGKVRYSSLKITRAEDGYAVRVISPDSRWATRPLGDFEERDCDDKPITWLPVQTLTYNPNKRKALKNPLVNTMLIDAVAYSEQSMEG